MSDEHGDSDEADREMPFWTYSDDEDLSDLAEAGQPGLRRAVR